MNNFDDVFTNKGYTSQKDDGHSTSDIEASEIRDYNATDSTISPHIAVELSEKLNGDSNALTEKLLPLIDVSSSVKKNKITQLRRTFSVDHNMLNSGKDRPTMYGSNDSLPSTSAKSTPPSEKESLTSSPKSRNSISSTHSLLRRRSLTKKLPSLPKTVPKRSLDSSKKIEKAVSTENLPLKNVEAKVHSIRKFPVRPRSQIVAAVTSRLYSKMKKHEVATDTHDISMYQEEGPKELTICSNARLQLRELTKKALKAHRSKNEETQTEHVPVAIVKERATDVDDFKLTMEEVKEVATMSDPIETKEIATECCLMDECIEDSSFKQNTKISSGTQYIRNDIDLDEEKKTLHPISFTKYLKDFQELSNSPIYTNSLNINISNNYLDGKKVSTSSSEDSLVEVNAPNDGLPTPDLISNHNSLEQHHSTTNESSKLARNLLKIFYETITEVQEKFSCVDILPPDPDEHQERKKAHLAVASKVHRGKATANLPSTYAPEIYTQYNPQQENCLPIPRFQPQPIKCDSVEYENRKLEECVVATEARVLKSIVKENLSKHQLSSSEEDIKFKTNVMDSLEYHMANKKVKFSETAGQEKRMIKAMSEFLEEATQLICKIDCCTSNVLDANYELEVTVNDTTGSRRGSRRAKKKPECPKSCTSCSIEKSDSSNQTYLPFRSDSSTQCEDDFVIPINKYEIVLEDTCRRLEEKIQRISVTSPRTNSIHEDLFAQGENPSDPDDSSLESNAVAFSDYGSLPRRRHKRYRRPTCSPSAFLKQLTNMRRQVIRSSREDLTNISNCNH